MTYQQLVDEHRARLALQWLRDGSLSVAEVSDRLGFVGPERFPPRVPPLVRHVTDRAARRKSARVRRVEDSVMSSATTSAVTAQLARAAAR